MESKFANLMNRFEKYVETTEGNVDNAALDRFEKLIERLEKVHYAADNSV